MVHTDEFNRIYQQVLGFATSGNQVNRVAVANLEKLTRFQLAALRSYTELGLEQLRAASEVSDLQGLQDFYTRQWEMAGTLNQKLLDDARALADLGAGFKADMDRLTQEGMTESGTTEQQAA